MLSQSQLRCFCGCRCWIFAGFCGTSPPPKKCRRRHHRRSFCLQEKLIDRTPSIFSREHDSDTSGWRQLTRKCSGAIYATTRADDAPSANPQRFFSCSMVTRCAAPSSGPLVLLLVVAPCGTQAPDFTRGSFGCTAQGHGAGVPVGRTGTGPTPTISTSSYTV